MSTLGSIWRNYTIEFSTAQKVVIGVVLAFIVCVALLAIVLLILEMTQ